MNARQLARVRPRTSVGGIVVGGAIIATLLVIAPLILLGAGLVFGLLVTVDTIERWGGR